MGHYSGSGPTLNFNFKQFLVKQRLFFWGVWGTLGCHYPKPACWFLGSFVLMRLSVPSHGRQHGVFTTRRVLVNGKVGQKVEIQIKWLKVLKVEKTLKQLWLVVLLIEEIPFPTPWHVWNPVNDGIFAISTDAGFLTSTVFTRICVLFLHDTCMWFMIGPPSTDIIRMSIIIFLNVLISIESRNNWWDKVPGDSKWPFYPPVGGQDSPFKGSRFHHPKKVTSRIAR